MIITVNPPDELISRNRTRTQTCQVEESSSTFSKSSRIYVKRDVDASCNPRASFQYFGFAGWVFSSRPRPDLLNIQREV